jgi:hypothetical protein
MSSLNIQSQSSNSNVNTNNSGLTLSSVRLTNERKHPTFEYYNTYIEMYARYPNEKDYFNQMYREHFLQTFHALGFCKMLKPVDSEELENKTVYLERKNDKRK